MRNKIAGILLVVGIILFINSICATLFMISEESADLSYILFLISIATIFIGAVIAKD